MSTGTDKGRQDGQGSRSDIAFTTFDDNEPHTSELCLCLPS